MTYITYFPWVASLLILVSNFYTVDGTVCSKEERDTDENACLQRIREEFVDANRFWFGYSYSTRCPSHLSYTIDCNNFRSSVNSSMASVLFQPVTTFDSSKIDRYLDVKFTSKPGEYTGCGHHFVRNTSEIIEVDPLADDTIQPWDVRDLPEMTWRVDPNKQYTLVIIDAGFVFLHGLYINIPGADMSKAEAIKEYSGPLNNRDVPNPYAFILFEQETNNMVSPVYQPINAPFLAFNMPEFATAANVKGPIAINWIIASFDPYGVQAMKESMGIENCATFITKAIEKENFTFIKADELPLHTYMEVKITSDPLDFSYCCQDHKLEGGTVTVDPISNDILSTAQTRTNSTITIQINSNKLHANVSADFKNSFLTVLTLDPDVPYASLGTTEKPLLHYMAYNYQVDHDGMLINGTTPKPYAGPNPPDGTHRYVFMLFFQNSKLDVLDSSDYTESNQCPQRLAGRCLFDVEKLKNDNSFTLISATFFRATRDAYVAVRRNDTAYCDSIPGGNPCGGKSPTSGCAGLVDMTLITLLFVTTVNMFVKT